MIQAVWLGDFQLALAYPKETVNPIGSTFLISMLGPEMNEDVGRDNVFT